MYKLRWYLRRQPVLKVKLFISFWLDHLPIVFVQLSLAIKYSTTAHPLWVEFPTHDSCLILVLRLTRASSVFDFCLWRIYLPCSRLAKLGHLNHCWSVITTTWSYNNVAVKEIDESHCRHRLGVTIHFFHFVILWWSSICIISHSSDSTCQRIKTLHCEIQSFFPKISRPHFPNTTVALGFLQLELPEMNGGILLLLTREVNLLFMST